MAIDRKTADQPAKRADVDVFLEGRPDLAGEGVRDELAKVANAVKAALPQLREGQKMSVRLPETPEHVRAAKRAYVESLAVRLKVNLVCKEAEAPVKAGIRPAENPEEAMARMMMEGEEPADVQAGPAGRTVADMAAMSETVEHPVQPGEPKKLTPSEAAAETLRKMMRRPRT